MKRKMISTLLFLLIMASIVAPLHFSSENASGYSEPLPLAYDEDLIMSRASEIGGETFTQNMGQIENGDVMFYASSGSVAFTQDSVFLYLSEPSALNESVSKQNPAARAVPIQNTHREMVRLSFAGSNNVVPVGSEPTTWHSNYLRGNDSSLWRTGITNYQKIIYKNLWDGIDLIYRVENISFKYEFVVHPFADTSDIKIVVEGQESLSINANDALIIALNSGRTITDSGLDVFYADNQNEKVAASFVLVDGDSYSFCIIDWNPARAMIIDPLIYSTFLGGSSFDYGVDVAVGDDGCAYLTGYTDSIDFPTRFDSYDAEYNGYTHDIFVTKMSLNGDTFVYSTFLGDTAGDYAQAIAVDDDGCAYITGYTMCFAFPITEGAFDSTYNGDTFDAFVTKLSPFGDSLIYSTFLGGDRVDLGYDIAVDRFGFAYVTGETWPIPTAGPPQPLEPRLHSGNFSFPTTLGAYQWSSGMSDIFVTKLDQLGRALVYSSAFGTDDFDYSTGIAVDENGYAYITGYTRSSGFPVSSFAFDRTHNGGYDAFAMKFSQSGTTLIFSTYLGGSDGDYGQSIEVGVWGHVYVTGNTGSIDFPMTAGSFDTTSNGAVDVFVAMLSKYGDALGYSTYLGGTSNDYSCDIALDKFGCPYVTGYTNSDDYPTTSNAFDNSYNGGADIFVSKLSTSDNSLLLSTYLGGTGNECGRGIGISEDGFAHIIGETDYSDLPTTAGVLDASFNGNSDVFVIKLDVVAPATNAGPDQRILEGQVANFNSGASTDNHGIVNYTWTLHYGSENVTMYGTAPQYLFVNPGIYAVMLNASDASLNWGTDVMIVTVVDITHPVARAGPDQIVNEDTLVFFNGSSSTDNVGIVNYTWMFHEGSKTTYLFGPYSNHTFSMPGIYIVTLEVTDAAGNGATDTLLVNITDITAPLANAGPDQRIYKDLIVNLDGTASKDNVAVANYTWTFNDGVENRIFYGATPSHLFTVPGIYPVTLNVVDAAGNFDTDQMMLTILEIIRPVAEAGPDIVVNEREQTRFDGSASTDNVGVAQWLWSFNDGLNDVTLFGVSPTWVFMISGVYEVTLNVSDDAGNWNTDTFTTSVLDATQPIAIAGANQIVIEGTTVTFSAFGSTDRSGITNYLWNFMYNGTLVTLNGANASFQFWAPGSYQVTLTVQDAAGNLATKIITITVQSIIIQENAIWVDEYGWILILFASAIMLLAATLFLHRRKKVIQP